MSDDEFEDYDGELSPDIFEILMRHYNYPFFGPTLVYDKKKEKTMSESIREHNINLHKQRRTYLCSIAIRNEDKSLTEYKFHDFNGEAETARDLMYSIHELKLTEAQALEYIQSSGTACSKVEIKS